MEIDISDIHNNDVKEVVAEIDKEDAVSDKEILEGNICYFLNNCFSKGIDAGGDTFLLVFNFRFEKTWNCFHEEERHEIVFKPLYVKPVGENFYFDNFELHRNDEVISYFEKSLWEQRNTRKWQIILMI